MKDLITWLNTLPLEVNEGVRGFKTKISIIEKISFESIEKQIHPKIYIHRNEDGFISSEYWIAYLCASNMKYIQEMLKNSDMWCLLDIDETHIISETKSKKFNIKEIAILKTFGTDIVTLKTDLPYSFDAYGSEEDNLVLKFETPKGHGEEYVKKHFPGFEFKIIDAR